MFGGSMATMALSVVIDEWDAGRAERMARDSISTPASESRALGQKITDRGYLRQVTPTYGVPDEYPIPKASPRSYGLSSRRH